LNLETAMKNSHFILAAVVATAAIVASQESRAADAATCGHPALARGAACAAPAGIDANTFIVQPPTSTRWVVRAPSANGDHPAVVVARMQRDAQVDANTFIVQPPVAVLWTVQEGATRLAGTPAATVR
jgi:hypothetical protein